MEVRDHGLYIAGKTLPASAGQNGEVLDPATNRPIARVASGTKDDVDAAVEAARLAFESPEWREMDPSKRGRLLWLLGQQVRDHFDELSRLESQNVGKPLREAKGDIAYVYKLFEYYAGLADKIQGETIPVPGARFDYTMREPLGVTAHIAPWNYPLLLASRGVAPALAAGNAVVLKPATLTPLTALKLGELAGAAGFPPGIVNVVTGPGRDVGAALAAHPDVDSVTFTGSTDTGKQLLRVVADRVVPTTLELGGKNPQIVLPDAKLDRVEAARARVDCALVPREAQGADGETAARAASERRRADGPPRLPRARRERRRGDRGRDRAGIEASRGRRSVRFRRAEGRKLCATDHLRGSSGPSAGGPRGGLRPGRGGMALRRGGRRHREGERHALRPRGGRLDPRHFEGARDRATAAGGHGLHQRVPGHLPADALPRVEAVGARSGARRRRGLVLHPRQECPREPRVTR